MAEVIAFKPIYLPQNKGLGNALKEALANCSNNLVARMIATISRFLTDLKGNWMYLLMILT
jgi:hypothetical protein